MSSKLQTIAEQILALTENSMDRPTIVYQTGPDESVLIGTESAILSFAASLLKSVADARSEEFLGVEVRSSDKINEALNNLGSCALDWVIVTKSDADTQELIHSSTYTN